jgi:hypothetical protein
MLFFLSAVKHCDECLRHQPQELPFPLGIGRSARNGFLFAHEGERGLLGLLRWTSPKG